MADINKKLSARGNQPDDDDDLDIGSDEGDNDEH